MKITQITDPLEALKLSRDGKMVYYVHIGVRNPGNYSHSIKHKTTFTQFKRLDLTCLKNFDPTGTDKATAYLLIEDVPEQIADAWAESIAFEV